MTSDPSRDSRSEIMSRCCFLSSSSSAPYVFRSGAFREMIDKRERSRAEERPRVTSGNERDAESDLHRWRGLAAKPEIKFL